MCSAQITKVPVSIADSISKAGGNTVIYINLPKEILRTPTVSEPVDSIGFKKYIDSVVKRRLIDIPMTNGIICPECTNDITALYTSNSKWGYYYPASQFLGNIKFNKDYIQVDTSSKNSANRLDIIIHNKEYQLQSTNTYSGIEIESDYMSLTGQRFLVLLKHDNVTTGGFYTATAPFSTSAVRVKTIVSLPAGVPFTSIAMGLPSAPKLSYKIYSIRLIKR